jgi:hypothetical protein
MAATKVPMSNEATLFGIVKPPILQTKAALLTH